jgi:hypothetical protein
MGSENGSTGLAAEGNTLYYGGEVSEHALTGDIAAGACQTGYLPFQGLAGVPYLQWGDPPDSPDATWWRLPAP